MDIDGMKKYFSLAQLRLLLKHAREKGKDMGCDIHAYSETKRNGAWEADKGDQAVKDEDSWMSMPKVGNGRDYWLFTILAGVRGESPWDFSDKGFPEDASAILEDLYGQWGDDAHTPSYLTMKELKEKCVELMLDGSKDALDYLESLKGFLDTITPTTDVLEDQRVVFWFDN